MLNEQKPKQTVCVWDPAIDEDAMGGAAAMSAWAQSRDFSKLVFRHGEKPVVFYLRTLPATLAHAYLGSAVGDGEKLMRAFRACVVRVDNVKTDNLSADVWEPARVDDERPRLSRIAEILTDAEVNEFDLTTIYEIGGVAHGLCFFPRTIEPRFVLPDLSAQTWDAMRASRLAELAKTSAASGTNESDKHAV